MAHNLGVGMTFVREASCGHRGHAPPEKFRELKFSAHLDPWTNLLNLSVQAQEVYGTLCVCVCVCVCV